MFRPSVTSMRIFVVRPAGKNSAKPYVGAKCAEGSITVDSKAL